jgi:hypothetical protein
VLVALNSRYARNACLYHVEAPFWRLVARSIRYNPMVGDSDEESGDPWGLHFSRLGVGIVAGFVVALVKAAADDTAFVSRLFDASVIDVVKSVLGYALVPMILGAVGGWISDERKVHKIFWVAISAPVIIAAAAASSNNSRPPQVLPVGKAGWHFEIISSAYADDATVKPPIVIADGAAPTVVADRPEDAFVGGFKAFFGIGRDGQRYRIVVASINDLEKAKATANHLNSLKILPAAAAVGERKIGNDYYPVVVDGWFTSYQAAKEFREKIAALDLGLPDPPYISVRDY